MEAAAPSRTTFRHVVSALGRGPHVLAPLSFKSASYSGVFTLYPLLSGEGRAHYGKILEQVANLVELDTVRPRVDPHRFDLTATYIALADDSACGKLVMEPNAEPAV